MRHLNTSAGFRRGAALAVGVALILSLAMPAVSGAAAAPKSSIRINKRTWPKAKTWTVSGKLAKKYKGQPITIEIRKPGRGYFVPIATRTVSKKGAWTWKYAPKIAGKFYIRARPRVADHHRHGEEGPGLHDQHHPVLHDVGPGLGHLAGAQADVPAREPPEYTMTGEQWKGTGQSLTDGAELGMADVILAHAPKDELLRVSQGYATNRHSVMYNYYAVLGPKTGGATIPAGASPVAAFGTIATWNDAQIPANQISFWSRNDNSGTNQMELNYWALAGNPQYSSGTTPKTWYYKTAAFGMGKVLNSVNAAGTGYTLTDRATWLFQSKAWTSGSVTNNLKVVATANTPDWFNLYSVLDVVKARNPEGAQDFNAWIRSSTAQSIIANYGAGQGYPEQLFYPYAGAY
jgi:tungstate transport system substrate-binding protein